MMSILPEKIALRRLLQNYLYRLDETIVELMGTSDTVGGSRVQFCEDFIVVWHDMPHVFSPSTYTLLQQFFETPNTVLSKEDIRQDVLYDDDASEGCIRQCISEARKELRNSGFPYRIDTITRKGYRLVKE
jgi:DNA-binding response OmpR family regulator